MPALKRTFGQAASLSESLPRGKEFTDAALSLDIATVLNESKITRKIGLTVARLSAESLQLEGDYASKRLVFAAYDGIYDLMKPSLKNSGIDDTVDMINSPLSRQTIVGLSRGLNSYSFSDVAYQYATRGKYLTVTDDGLGIQEGITFPESSESKIGGCPYAKSERAREFNIFTDRIVETYAEAHSRDMPKGWLSTINNAIRRM